MRPCFFLPRLKNVALTGVPSPTIAGHLPHFRHSHWLTLSPSSSASISLCVTATHFTFSPLALSHRRSLTGVLSHLLTNSSSESQNARVPEFSTSSPFLLTGSETLSVKASPLLATVSLCHCLGETPSLSRELQDSELSHRLQALAHHHQGYNYSISM
ncbi:hypothetical protein PIB30_081103 [Stylosanthes scabra]|uniref:Uncharacterized protein n=1 Tax=Stylosanthes scabra TaxID=79078 RepID=A0ABU6ZQE5_9FABA|nr:hypothetical protein [Stylosanthes scabra]